MISYPDIVSEEVSHNALNDVKANICSKLVNSSAALNIPSVTHMRVIVNCRPTHIPSDKIFVLMPWNKNFLI